MIQNDEQLAIVRQQITRLESALQSLAKTVRPKSESQFRVFAEGYVDQLETLRAEVDAYLGITEVLNREPDPKVSIAGQSAASDNDCVSAVGVIREVDLDRRLFSLRELKTGATVERCKYGKAHDAAVARFVNNRVEVTGTRRSHAVRATRLRVKGIRQVAEGE